MTRSDRPTGIIRWSMATELIFHIGALWQVAYLSTPAKQIMGVWVFLAIILVPIFVLLFFRHGEYSDEVVARAHLLAAVWYLTLTLICVALAIAGYHRPRGWIIYLVFIAPGAFISLWVIRDHLRDAPSPEMPTG